MAHCGLKWASYNAWKHVMMLTCGTEGCQQWLILNGISSQEHARWDSSVKLCEEPGISWILVGIPEVLPHLEFSNSKCQILRYKYQLNITSIQEIFEILNIYTALVLAFCLFLFICWEVAFVSRCGLSEQRNCLVTIRQCSRPSLIQTWRDWRFLFELLEFLIIKILQNANFSTKLWVQVAVAIVF